MDPTTLATIIIAIVAILFILGVIALVYWYAPVLISIPLTVIGLVLVIWLFFGGARAIAVSLGLPTTGGTSVYVPPTQPGYPGGPAYYATPLPGQTPAAGMARNLGLAPNELTPPASAGGNETLVFHGDVTRNGQCSIRVFGPGQQTSFVSGGTFRVVSLQGNPQQNGDAIVRIQQAAAADAGGSCPYR